MIYAKRLNSNGLLLKIEKGKRIVVDPEATSDRGITKREYCCLNCAIRVMLDKINADSLSPSDWGIEDE